MGIGVDVHEEHQVSQMPQVKVDVETPREAQVRIGIEKDEYPNIPLRREYDQLEKESHETNTQTPLMLEIGQLEYIEGVSTIEENPK